MILREWETDAYAPMLQGRKVFYVCEESCTLLGGEDGEVTDSQPFNDLFSSQEEADTRIVLHCVYATRQGSIGALVV